jgi:hypothetical protein
MKEVALSQGKVALVDNQDYVLLMNGPKWHAKKDRYTFYAERVLYKPNGTKTTETMHRFIMGLIQGDPKTDHKDGNGLNNQRHNLRIATTAQNNQNTKLRKDNKSGVRGVSWHKGIGKWHAQISLDGNIKSLGYFSYLKAAQQARAQAEIMYHGEFSALTSRQGVNNAISF